MRCLGRVVLDRRGTDTAVIRSGPREYTVRRAASVAGVKRAIADGIIKKNESVCAVITGNGLKDIKAAIETAGTPIHIAPDLKALDEELKKRKG